VKQQSNFIVFEKRAEAQSTDAITEAEVAASARLRTESDQIAELRRVITEITETEPEPFTTT
jgi:hypothetical protein